MGDTTEMPWKCTYPGSRVCSILVRQVNLLLTKLWILLAIAHKLAFLPHRQCEHASRKIDEVGRVLDSLGRAGGNAEGWRLNGKGESMQRPMRVYVDTSVFGGAFDGEFQEASGDFFDRVRAGEFRLVISPTVSDELRDAPEPVRVFFRALEPFIEVAEIDEAAMELQAGYLDAHIVSSRWEADALHVAVATVSLCPVIVSWNFKHIVNFRRIPLYNGVNLTHGFQAIAIHTPQEVLSYDDEDDTENV
jgi:predicted nucleic acid-binding protein